jgi:hypothetical protein
LTPAANRSAAPDRVGEPADVVFVPEITNTRTFVTRRVGRGVLPAIESIDGDVDAHQVRVVRNVGSCVCPSIPRPKA